MVCAVFGSCYTKRRLIRSLQKVSETGTTSRSGRRRGRNWCFCLLRIGSCGLKCVRRPALTLRVTGRDQARFAAVGAELRPAADRLGRRVAKLLPHAVASLPHVAVRQNHVRHIVRQQRHPPVSLSSAKRMPLASRSACTLSLDCVDADHPIRITTQAPKDRQVIVPSINSTAT
jgi:hypothetical protein